MPFDFQEKKILVTGAGKDFGLAAAKAITLAGGKVYALDSNKEKIESLFRESSNIHPVIVDLKNWDASMVELEKLHAMDGVINAQFVEANAGALEAGKDPLEEILKINLMAPINVIQVTAKEMIEISKHGSVVNFSRAVKAFLGYCVPKAGLDIVTKQFALELGVHQIHVNSVNAGFTWNDSVKELVSKNPAIEEKVKAMPPTCIGRFNKIHEVLESILYLLSDHSSMVTGTNHLVDWDIFSNITV